MFLECWVCGIFHLVFFFILYLKYTLWMVKWHTHFSCFCLRLNEWMSRLQFVELIFWINFWRVVRTFWDVLRRRFSEFQKKMAEYQNLVGWSKHFLIIFFKSAKFRAESFQSFSKLENFKNLSVTVFVRTVQIKM